MVMGTIIRNIGITIDILIGASIVDRLVWKTKSKSSHPSEVSIDLRRRNRLISKWRQLFQVGPSCVKLILVGLFCPPVGQEFTEGLAVFLVAGDPE